MPSAWGSTTSGALTGAGLGAMVGGPVGAAIGGGVGALGGLVTGIAGNTQNRKNKKQLLADEIAMQQGQLGLTPAERSQAIAAGQSAVGQQVGQQQAAIARDSLGASGVRDLGKYTAAQQSLAPAAANASAGVAQQVDQASQAQAEARRQEILAREIGQAQTDAQQTAQTAAGLKSGASLAIQQGGLVDKLGAVWDAGTQRDTQPLDVAALPLGSSKATAPGLPPALSGQTTGVVRRPGEAYDPNDWTRDAWGNPTATGAQIRPST